jgi:hypothetical protein
LKSGKTEKLKSSDVPDEWDDTRISMPPYFIPFEYGQILFGGNKKGFQELIGSIFIKPVEKTKPESPVKTQDNK